MMELRRLKDRLEKAAQLHKLVLRPLSVVVRTGCQSPLGQRTKTVHQCIAMKVYLDAVKTVSLPPKATTSKAAKSRATRLNLDAVRIMKLQRMVKIIWDVAILLNLAVVLIGSNLRPDRMKKAAKKRRKKLESLKVQHPLKETVPMPRTDVVLMEKLQRLESTLKAAELSILKIVLLLTLDAVQTVSLQHWVNEVKDVTRLASRQLTVAVQIVLLHLMDLVVKDVA